MLDVAFRGNGLTLRTPKTCGAILTALFHWQSTLIEYEEDEEEFVPAPLPTKLSRMWAVFAKIGISPANAEGRRRVRVSLWSGMSADSAPDNHLVSAEIDRDHEVELDLLPVFLRFQELIAPGPDGDREFIGFPGAILILSPEDQETLRLHWNSAFPKAIAHWDVLHHAIMHPNALVDGVPEAPPLRPRAQTPGEMIQNAREARQKRHRSDA